jgi:hypothetical protein
MSSFSRAVRFALLAAALTLPLAACTGIRPVYSDAGLGAHEIKVKYGAPNSRLEQIIYQELALKLGKGGDGNDAIPTVTVQAWSGNDGLTNNTVSTPFNQRIVTVYAQLTVTAPDGAVLFSGQRSETSDLGHDWQTLANQQASDTAQKQAALLLANTLKLQVMAALSKWQH